MAQWARRQIDPAQVQARVTGACAVGQYVRSIAPDGAVTCGTDAFNVGTVTSITAGSGLSGGAITGVGTIGIAPGGVTGGMLATGAVGRAQIATGAVGAAQIDPAQVQARISGTCPLGQYFRGIAADGSVVCEPVPGGASDHHRGRPRARGRALHFDGGRDGRSPRHQLPRLLRRGLKVAKCANTACTGVPTITTVDDLALVGQYTSIAIGTDGLPVISY